MARNHAVVSAWMQRAFAKIGSFLATVVILVLFLFGLFRALGAPVPVAWTWQTLTGQFGASYHGAGGPVLPAIVDFMPATLELVASSIVVALAIGHVLGSIARRSSARVAGLIDGVGLLMASLPAFWFVLLAQLFVVTHSALPVAGIASTDRLDVGDRFVHLILPATLLALVQVSSVLSWSVRRGGMADLVATIARKLPTVFAIGFLVEIVFGWPGDGRLLFNTLLRGGGPLLAVVLVYAVFSIAARTATAADA